MTLPPFRRPLAVAIAVAGTLAAAGPALAAQVTVTPRLAAPGTQVQITAGGFAPGESLATAFGTLAVGTLTAGPSGSVSALVEVPEELAPGLTELRLTGPQSGVATASFRARTNWAQLGQTAEHGFANGSENVLSPATVTGLTRLFRAPVGDAAAPVRSGPVVASGRVYVGSEDGSVRAFGSISGRERWRRAVGAPVRTTPAAAYRLLFVTSGDRLLALDSATGAVVWKRTLDAELGSPAVSDFGVFVQDANGKVYGLHAVDDELAGIEGGTDLWPARALAATGGRPRTPTIDDERLLTIVDGGASGDVLVVLDSATGAERRRVPLWPAVAIGGTANPASFDAADPVTARVGNATVTIVAPGDVARLQSLATFSARTGDLVGTGKLDAGRTFSTAVALPGTARIGGTTEGVASLGSWATATSVPSTPALVAGGLAFAGAADGVRALSSTTGAVLWTSTGTAAVEAPPAIADGRVYVSSAAGYVDAFALASPPTAGTAAGSFTPSSAKLGGSGAVRLRVAAVSPQRVLRSRRITLRVTCSPACRITADGTARIGGRARSAGAPSWTRVRPVRRDAADGRTVVVRLPIGVRQRKALARALDRGRRVQVRVNVRGAAKGLKTATVTSRVTVRR